MKSAHIYEPEFEFMKGVLTADRHEAPRSPVPGRSRDRAREPGDLRDAPRPTTQITFSSTRPAFQIAP